MSNVLIGIIGVILFIGLALAGALFLGERFREANNHSKAMAISQMISQIVSASTLYHTETSKYIVARTPLVDLRAEGYLKALPGNPLLEKGGFPFRLLYSGDLQSSGYYADMAIASIGPLDEAYEICRAINRFSMKSDSVAEIPISVGADMSSALTGTNGCFRMHDVGIPGEANPHDYIIYSKL